MKGVAVENSNCRLCNNLTLPVIDFGSMPIANRFKRSNEENSYRFNMKTSFCPSCALFQLDEVPNPDQMFNSDYPFFTGLSRGMQEHFKKLAHDFERYVSEEGLVVEIGSNDGTLLRHFLNDKRKVIGVEPSASAAVRAQEKGIHSLVEFFSHSVSEKIIDNYGQADLVLAANVVCHIPQLSTIFQPVRDLLSFQGVFVFEEPYLLDMLDNVSYDQIYDEHVYIFSISAISRIAERFGLELIDAIPQWTHGGSMRYVLAHKGVFDSRLSQILLERESLYLSNYSMTMTRFAERVAKKTSELKTTISSLKSQGMKVSGYAATSKSTTILNYAGLSSVDLDYIIDITPEKVGKVTPGTNIPIVTREYALSNPPDYLLLFAWNHKEEVLIREKEFSAKGVKWINWAPRVEIL